MPNTAIETLLAPILKEFSERIAKAVEGATLARMRAAVDSAFAESSPTPNAPGRRGRPAGTKSSTPKPKPVASVPNPKLAERRRTQGLYMGLLRNFEGSERAQVKAAAAKGGLAAGVELARKLLAKRT